MTMIVINCRGNSRGNSSIVYDGDQVFPSLLFPTYLPVPLWILFVRHTYLLVVPLLILLVCRTCSPVVFLSETIVNCPSNLLVHRRQLPAVRARSPYLLVPLLRRLPHK